jgi:hypothetical protein
MLMRAFRTLLPVIAALCCAVLVSAAPPPPNTYVPPAQFCYPALGAAPGNLCPVLPGNIGPDPILKYSRGYHGIMGGYPTGPDNDAESPFDNYSWQVFVALNWTKGKEHLPPAQGLQGEGPRVWQGWSRVSQVFGNSPVQANCQVGAGEMLFSIGSNGDRTPSPRNEEYIQASTGDPAIDVAGNWTLYERRVNGIEIAYLRAPNGKAQWNLTNATGQSAFAAGQGVVNFPAVSPPGTRNGAMEIKAAWRMLDPKNHAANVKKYFVVRAVVGVAPDLVDRAPALVIAPICTHVDLGLVAMHIIQKNPQTVPVSNLNPQWFWTTFEHVDNAPLAKNACDITHPIDCTAFPQSKCPAEVLMGAPDYSYFDRHYQNLVNVVPTPAANGTFFWNGTQPFAKKYMTPVSAGSHTYTGTQIARCWQVYKLTQELNVQWQRKLREAGSVFANYMLIGTQWGGNVEPTFPAPGPSDVVPNYLSNSVLETFLQTSFDAKNPQPFNTGSCITCHSVASFSAKGVAIEPVNVASDFSFLPGLVNTKGRRPPIGMPGHDAFFEAKLPTKAPSPPPQH